MLPVSIPKPEACPSIAPVDGPVKDGDGAWGRSIPPKLFQPWKGDINFQIIVIYSPDALLREKIYDSVFYTKFTTHNLQYKIER